MYYNQLNKMLLIILCKIYKYNILIKLLKFIRIY